MIHQTKDSKLSITWASTMMETELHIIVHNIKGICLATELYYDFRRYITKRNEPITFGFRYKIISTYTGQPLKTTVTEGLTTVTENTYHAASGLLTATDVTVNGVKQRVSAIEYDDLGRIASVTRGAATNSGGKVSYTYNLHGQMTEISGPGFSQNLHYADGPGKKLYNGSVSAMTWTMGSDTRVRGYKYAYNGYGWLTAAEYGENANLGSNPNRYTERSLEFMLNGGIRRLQRHGLKADGNYGKVDNLHIYYDGNRITGVLDDALHVTQNGSMDFPVSGKEMAMEYNGWGALVKDESRKITNISYDRLGNPLRISYSNGAYTEYVYSATGEKLRMTHGTSLNAASTGMEPYGDMESTEDTASEPMAAASSATSVTEYHGNVIYRDGKPDMVLFPGGYATLDGGVTFHYYTKDYLGNNRAVINGSTGAIEQTIAYYPYGGVIADLGNPTGGQPYKFGGKELITTNGLNEYDFGARQYYPAIPGFTKPDQLAEKYPWLSPYLYCANNPVNAVDPSGMELCFTGGSENEYKYICQLLNNITQNQYTFSFITDPNTHTTTINYVENPSSSGGQPDNQNTVTKEIIGIIDHANTTTLNISSSSDVLIGDARSKTIDLEDIKNIGERDAVTSESAFFHEVYEQYRLQSRNKEFTNKNIRQAHNAASQMEEMLLNISISPERDIVPSNASNLMEKGIINVPYNKKRGSIEYPYSTKLKYNNGLILP